MSQGMSAQFVKETYEKMSDEELIRQLTQDAAGLTPEALQVVKDEVGRRKLSTNLINGVEAQQKSYTLEEIDTYCDLVRTLPCPITGDNNELLNATFTSTVMSFIVFTNCRKEVIVGSPAALDKANNKALLLSLILGWWGIPWGIIRTFQAINTNLKNKKSNHLATPNNYLRSFVLSRIGEIETFKNDKQKLFEIISTK